MSEELVLISGRVRKSTRLRLKIYAAENEVQLQEVLDRALDEYLTRHGARAKAEGERSSGEDSE